jgi:hypothetical protein
VISNRRFALIIVLLVVTVGYIIFGVIPQYFGCLNRGGVPVEAVGYWACVEVKQ